MTQTLGNGGLWKNIWKTQGSFIMKLGGAAVFLIARPSSDAFFLPGALIVFLGEAVRLWAAGHAPRGREELRDGPYAMMLHPFYFGYFLIVGGFAVMCVSTRHRLSTLIVFAAAAALWRRRYQPGFWPDWSRFLEAAASNQWSWRNAAASRELRNIFALLGLILVLRLKMAYRF